MKYYLQEIIKDPFTKNTLIAVYSNGWQTWKKKFDIEGSCIPTTIIDEDPISPV